MSFIVFIIALFVVYIIIVDCCCKKRLAIENTNVDQPIENHGTNNGEDSIHSDSYSGYDSDGYITQDNDYDGDVEYDPCCGGGGGSCSCCSCCIRCGCYSEPDYKASDDAFSRSMSTHCPHISPHPHPFSRTNYNF